MKSLLIKPLLILAFLSVGLNKVRAAADVDNEWFSKHDKVYALHGPLVGHEDLLNMLKDLEATYLKLQDESSNRKLPIIRNLLWASRITESRCGKAVFDKYDALIEFNRPFALNLHPYLKHYKDKQYEMCFKFLTDHIKAALESEFNDKDHDELMELVNNIITANGGIVGQTKLKLPIDHDKFMAGILEFVEKRMGKLDARETHRWWRKRAIAYLRKVLQDSVGNMCQKVDSTLGPSLKLYRNLRCVKDHKIKNDLDDYAKEWLTYAKVCHFIIHQNKELVNEFYAHVTPYEAHSGNKFSLVLNKVLCAGKKGN